MTRSRSASYVACVLFFVSGCANDGHAPGGSDIQIPEITKPVQGGASLASVIPMATTGAPLNAESCTVCGSNTAFSFVHSMASIFVFQGKFADANSCMVSALAGADVIPGLTSGEAKYIDSGEIKMKVQVQVSGNVVTSLKMFTCQNNSQVQYVGATNTGGDVTFTFRSSGTGNFMAMDAVGKLVGEQWSSKTLEVGFNSTLNGNYSHSTVIQNAERLDVTGVMDSGTLGTLDANDVRFVSRAQLIGNTLQTYALGDGSIRMATGSGSQSNTNWNGDTGTHGSGPTTYDSAVASATLPAVPTTRASAFTTEEQWDCQPQGEEINLMAKAMGNDALIKKVMACQEILQ